MGGVKVVGGELGVSCGEVAGDWEGEEAVEEAGDLESGRELLLLRRVSHIIWSTLRCFRSASNCFATSSTYESVNRANKEQ